MEESVKTGSETTLITSGGLFMFLITTQHWVSFKKQEQTPSGYQGGS
jgi:hypothetical protein